MQRQAPCSLYRRAVQRRLRQDARPQPTRRGMPGRKSAQRQPVRPDGAERIRHQDPSQGAPGFGYGMERRAVTGTGREVPGAKFWALP